MTSTYILLAGIILVMTLFALPTIISDTRNHRK
jgi:hypothetical protein